MSRNDVLWYLVEGETEQKVIAALKNEYLYPGKVIVLNITQDYLKERFLRTIPHELNVKTTPDFHDRFLIIDDTEGYFMGASVKDVGKKSFAITKIEDGGLVQNLVDKVR